MIAILKKELLQYLYSVTGAIFLSINIFIMGLYFQANNLLGMSNSLAPVMQGIVFILMMVSPLLTMRLMSEEKRLRTDQLLLTSPVSIPGIVLGKYLSVLVIFLIPVLISCFLPLFLSGFGVVAFSESYLAIFSYALFGATCLSVGLFISSLTENQLIAAVLSFLALFLTYLMGGIVDILTRGDSGFNPASVLRAFDFLSRLEHMMTGILDFKDILYYVSVIILMLFFTCQTLLKRRYTVSKDTLKLTVYSNLSIVIFTAVMVLVNVGVSFIPSERLEIDLTRGKLYSLSPEARDFIKSFNSEITIYAAGTREMFENYNESEVLRTLDSFSSNPSITVKYIDTAANPSFFENITDDPIMTGSLVIVNGERHKILSESDLYESQLNYETYSSERISYDGEGQIAAACSFVTKSDIPKIYALSGHGELALDNFPYISRLIQKQNLEAEDINLMSAGNVPEDGAALLILGPRSDISDTDAAAIEEYLNKGGLLIAAIDFTAEPTPNLDSIYEEHGIERVNGIILEEDYEHMYQAPMNLLPDVNYSYLTDEILERNLLALLPQSCGFKVDGEAEEALTTSSSSYAKTGNLEEALLERQAGDIEGPFAVAVYLDGAAEEDEAVSENGTASENAADSKSSFSGKIALFGCTAVFADDVIQRTGGANASIFAKLLRTIPNEGVSVSIPGKSYGLEYVTVPYSTVYIFIFVFNIAIPLCLLIAGIVLWVRRKRR